MLNLLLGRARTGKTQIIMEEIKRKMSEGETGMLLIVPEQYSHDAERRLCDVCGDSLSLHAEALSFTRLCELVFSETGCTDRRIIDKSGQILVMHKAIESVAPSLKVFGIRKMRAELLTMLVETVTELKGLCISAKMLEKVATKTQAPLIDKLHDIALITDAYYALLKTYGADTATRLELLEQHISESSVGSTGHIYIDGFIDFTAQEMRIIEKLLLKGAQVTICITYDPDGVSSNQHPEIFNIPERTVAKLRQMPVEVKSIVSTEKRVTSKSLAHIEKHLFDDETVKYTDKTEAVLIYAAPTRYEECEYAAFEIWKLIKAGYRWRDIGVMARDWQEYEAICESIFEKYEIPYFSSGKADIATKPPVALIDAALETIITGRDYKSIFKYLKTGLLELSTDDIAILENYVITWKIRGSLWQREWKMPPSGYSSKTKKSKETNKEEELLKYINSLREKIIKPLNNLNEGIKGESTAQSKLSALCNFINEISLPKTLRKKADDYRARNQLRLADEYTQIINIIEDAVGQMFMILGESKINESEFKKLLTIVLSQHDVGVIPIALDRTPLGSMAMSRRRDLRCLILLGATDENLPALYQDSRILTDNERQTLAGFDLNITAGIEERMYREMNMIYSTLTLPSDKLIMIYPTAGGAKASFLIKKMCEMFDINKESLTREEYMTAAKTPYLELMYKYKHQGDKEQRENLSKQAAQLIYGNEISLSATQADRYYSCAYKHFLQNGLRLEPRVKAEFDAASAGNFIHYVLDGVFSEIKAGVGFKSADDMLYSNLTSKYASRFVNEVLHDFEGKDTRFKYLYKRYEETAGYVVCDMANELKNSDFEPMELEMDMSELSGTQRGYIDRADGYKYGDKLYMRVIDYKTRKKAYAFDLSDIYHGRDMQMLIYLFALEKYGFKKFGMEIEPAGVLYVPARDVIVSISRNDDMEEIEKKRLSQMRRSGLILDNHNIIEAMETGESKKYIPVSSSKDGIFTGSSIVSKDRLLVLSKHVEAKMSHAKEEILNGINTCKPYYRSAGDNACIYCEYFAVCRFDEELGDKRGYTGKMKPEEVWEKIENIKE